MKNALNQLKNAVYQANKSTSGLVNIEKMSQSFKDSGRFNAEVHRYFPSEARKIDLFKRELKAHHYHLAGLIKDVSVLS